MDIASVQAHSLEWHENAGQLSKMKIDEGKILPENRIPRVTAATWYDHMFSTVGRFNYVIYLFPRAHDTCTMFLNSFFDNFSSQLSGSMTVGP